MFSYRNKMLMMLPRWGSSVFGTELWAVMSAIGEELNRAAFFHRWSFLVRLIEFADDATLNEHGKLRKILRTAIDTTETYRTRLLNAWSFYRSLGTSKAIVDSFKWLGYRAEVICNKDWPVDTWDGPGARYDLARYDIDVYDTADTWDGDDTWDASGPPDGGTMWNRFWVKVYDIDWTPDTWDGADTWDGEDSWDSPDLVRLRVFTDIVLRCRACYNLFVGFILVDSDGVETFVDLNLE